MPAAAQRYHQKVHTLGNSLGNNQASNAGKQSLNLSQQIGGALSLNYNHIVGGGYKGDSNIINNLSLANRTADGKYHLNLTSLLKSSNILDEDGIEDLHFYFVSFNQHKNSILKI
jgi:hypothetical protein